MNNDNVINLIEGGNNEPLPTRYTIVYQGVDGLVNQIVDGWLAVTGGMTLVLNRHGNVIFGTQNSLIVEFSGVPGEDLDTSNETIN